MPRELSRDAGFLETSAASVWGAAKPLHRDEARPVATWCSQLMRVPPERLPSSLRALPRDGGVWLAALMSNASDRVTRACGVFLMRPATPIAEMVGAPGFIRITQRIPKARRDDARYNSMIVIGLPDALAIAGAAPSGQLFAVPDAETLLAIELPGELRCLAIAYPAGDASFGDTPVIACAVRRFRQQGRRVRVIGEAYVGI